MSVGELWNIARPINEYFKSHPSIYGLTRVDYKMSAYGDWYLYRDREGNYWVEYMSCGD